MITFDQIYRVTGDGARRTARARSRATNSAAKLNELGFVTRKNNSTTYKFNASISVDKTPWLYNWGDERFPAILTSTDRPIGTGLYGINTEDNPFSFNSYVSKYRSVPIFPEDRLVERSVQYAAESVGPILRHPSGCPGQIVMSRAPGPPPSRPRPEAQGCSTTCFRGLRSDAAVLVDGVSKRQILRETACTGPRWRRSSGTASRPATRRQDPGQAQARPLLDRIAQILADDRQAPRKQRHTAKRIYQRLCEEGYGGGYTVVKAVVRDLRSRAARSSSRSCTGRRAQVDFGEAVVQAAGRLRKVAFLVMALPHSDAFSSGLRPRVYRDVLDGHAALRLLRRRAAADHLRQQPCHVAKIIGRTGAS